jgi:hypothetical protein
LLTDRTLSLWLSIRAPFSGAAATSTYRDNFPKGKIMPRNKRYKLATQNIKVKREGELSPKPKVQRPKKIDA